MKRIALRNRYESTRPLAVHANGVADSRVWQIIKDQFFATAGKFSPVADHAQDQSWRNNLTLATWNNVPERGVFEQSCKVLGVPVRVFDIKPKSKRPNTRATYPVKIEGTLQILDKIDTPFVLLADSWDLILLDSPGKILETWMHMENRPVVFGAERGHFPKDMWTRDSEIKQATHHDRPHLNSGFVIGFTEDVRKVYEAAKRAGDVWPEGQLLTDQAAIKAVYERENYDISLDHRCQLVQNLFGVEAGELEIEYIENGLRLETV